MKPEMIGDAVTMDRQDMGIHEVIPEVLLDPEGMSPMQVHDLPVAELESVVLPKLLDGAKWDPPMKLTQQEKEIVNREQATLLLGRSGTFSSRWISSPNVYL